jgi:phage terminase small subunit
MSKGAARIWDRLCETMDPQILRTTDQDALAALCEDQSLLDESYAGLHRMVSVVKKRAAAEKKELPAGPLAAVLLMTNGRLALAAIRDLAARVIVRQREFGLSPASRCRIDASGGENNFDELDDVIFNRKAERLVPPKPN